MTQLPIDEVLADVVDHLDVTGTVVVTAPPGAGKTTRVPLALVDRPWRTGRVVVLEPRRVAARAAAVRMAQDVGDRLGGLVGLTTRDERRVGPSTVVEVVTEGVLVRRLLRDGDLPGVSAVLFDEFHERSLDADLGLALCLEVREVLRPDLRLGVLSATIDADRVAELIGPGTPVVASQGRSFPVGVTHVAAPPLAGMRPRELAAHVAPAVAQALRDHPGDALVFLPGVREIAEVRAGLAGVGVDLVELHGSLPPKEQDRALRPGERRRVVLATDLAESSVTVPGVRIVVDAGLTREPRLDARLGMTRLVTVTASRASADQRAGRAGRVEPGHAVRLWPASSHGARPPWPVPELAQGDLAELVLAFAAWGTPLDQARLLDDPPAPAVADALATLGQLQALDDDGRITDHGRQLVDLPMHPRLGHLVVRAAEGGIAEMGVRVAALLAERDVLAPDRNRPDADVVSRVRLLDGAARSGRVRDAVLARVRRDLGRTQRLVDRIPARGEPLPGDPEHAVGLLLALAWPDRIGRRRDGRRGNFQLANGRGAVLPDGDPLAGEDWIVAADVDAGAVDARVHRAAALDPAAFDGVLAPLVRQRRRVEWDDTAGDVVAVEEHVVGSLVLRSRTLPTGEVDLRPALLDALRQRGLELLGWSAAAEQLRARLDLLHRALGEPWPDVSDAALLAEPERWLPLPRSARRLADLRKADVVAGLQALVPPGRHDLFHQLAPTHLEVPTGSRIRLDYTPEGPVLAVKVQEVFGWQASPTVADGRVPVTMHLLSPAGRPLQVTRDLAGFWDGTWTQVRAEMRGRYPKHAWPEDPRTVEPHRGTRHRRR